MSEETLEAPAPKPKKKAKPKPPPKVDKVARAVELINEYSATCRKGANCGYAELAKIKSALLDD